MDEAADVRSCQAGRSGFEAAGTTMLTEVERELRKRTEQAISAYLPNAYDVQGDVCTVVKGANWRLVIDDGGETVANVRLYRTTGRSPDDIARERPRSIIHATGFLIR